MILSYCQRVNGYGRHKFYKGYIEENIYYIIVENMIESCCQRVNGYGRHKFDIGYVGENKNYIIVENMIQSYCQGLMLMADTSFTQAMLRKT